MRPILAGARGLKISEMIPWILTIVATAVGVWQFTRQQDLDTKKLIAEMERSNAEHEQAAKTPFLMKQLELTFNAVDTAAALAVETDPIKWEVNRNAFWRQYWGVLSMVESPGVETAMIALGNIVPKRPVPSPELPMAELGAPAYNLAHASRDLILASWKIELQPLQNLRLNQGK